MLKVQYHHCQMYQILKSHKNNLNKQMQMKNYIIISKYIHGLLNFIMIFVIKIKYHKKKGTGTNRFIN
jgi:hypothetical protein